MKRQTGLTLALALSLALGQFSLVWGQEKSAAVVNERLDRLEKALKESQEKNRLLEEKIERLEQRDSASPSSKPSAITNDNLPAAAAPTPPSSGVGHYIGSDLPPSTAVSETPFARSAVTTEPDEDLYNFAKKTYDTNDLRDIVLGGLRFHGFIDTRFIFDEDELFDGLQTFNFRMQEAEIDISKRFNKLAFLRADVNVQYLNGKMVPGLQQGYAGVALPFLADTEFWLGRFNSVIGSEGPDVRTRVVLTESFLKYLALPENFTGAQVMTPFYKNETAYAKFFFVIAEGWNLYVDNNHNKDLIGRIEVSPTQELVIGVSGGGGAEQPNNDSNWRKFVDVDLIYKPIPKLELKGDFVFGDEDNAQVGVTPTFVPIYRNASWWGAQGTLLYHVVRWLDVGGRFEIFRDENGARFFANPYYRSVAPKAPGQAIQVEGIAGLLSLNVTEGAKVRVEYQFDIGNGPTFVDRIGLLEHNDNVITFQFLYVF